MLNHWRMAQLHAQEAPDRVWELEDWGALFDRTPDGLITQRDFGGHRYARLAHVGDRTGLEMIRTLQQRPSAAAGRRASSVFMECTITELLTDADGAIAGAFGYWRETGRFIAFEAPVGGAGHRRHRQALQGHLQLLGVHRRRPRAGAAGRRDADQHGVRPVPPDRHGVAAVGEGACWSPSRSAATAASCRTPTASGSCSTTSPSSSSPRRADTEEEADRWYDDKKNNRRPPELLPRDEVARAINTEVKAGRGSAARRRLPRHRLAAHAASTSTSGCPRCTTSSRSWPTSTSPRSRWRSARPATT